MSQPDDDSQEALKRLDERLAAFKAQDASKTSADGSAERSMGEGYRLLGEVIGGILGGLGLGYVFDRVAHTTPFGLVIGLLLGTAASAYVAVKAGERSGRRMAKGPPAKED
ncbi:MAG TPA: AtpZ/AtpI family protein [Caulobacteraceae bacterium]|nr:AtpZ/AtpI family protein [Caulobacteraceae bacterium]